MLHWFLSCLSSSSVLLKLRDALNILSYCFPFSLQTRHNKLNLCLLQGHLASFGRPAAIHFGRGGGVSASQTHHGFQLEKAGLENLSHVPHLLMWVCIPSLLASLSSRLVWKRTHPSYLLPRSLSTAAQHQRRSLMLCLFLVSVFKISCLYIMKDFIMNICM